MSIDEIWACGDINTLKSWLCSSVKERDRILLEMRNDRLGLALKEIDMLLDGRRLYSSITTPEGRQRVFMKDADYFL